MRFKQRGSNSFLKEFSKFIKRLQKLLGKQGNIKAFKKVRHKHPGLYIHTPSVYGKQISFTLYGRGNTTQEILINCPDDEIRKKLIFEIAKERLNLQDIMAEKERKRVSALKRFTNRGIA